MPVKCPRCNRAVVSYNFKYCLYCSAPFDEEILQQLEKEKEAVKRQSFDKDFIEWKYKSVSKKVPDAKFTKFVKIAAVVLLLLIAGSLLYIVVRAFEVAGESSASRFSSLYLFIALPMVVVMVLIVGYMVYKIFKK